MPSRPVFPIVLTAAAILALPAPALAMSQDEKQVAVAFFIAVALVVGLALLTYYRIAVQRHQTLRAMVEKEMEIPPGLLGQGAAASSAGRDQRRGILLVCAGVGIGLFFLAEGGPEEGMLGMIPVLIGVGYLIVARLQARAASARELDQPALP